MTDLRTMPIPQYLGGRATEPWVLNVPYRESFRGFIPHFRVVKNLETRNFQKIASNANPTE